MGIRIVDNILQVFNYRRFQPPDNLIITLARNRIHHVENILLDEFDFGQNGFISIPSALTLRSESETKADGI